MIGGTSGDVPDGGKGVLRTTLRRFSSDTTALCHRINFFLLRSTDVAKKGMSPGTKVLIGVGASVPSILLEAVFVSGRPEQRRHLCAHQSQVHRHLSAMMRPVADRLLDHLMAGAFLDH